MIEINWLENFSHKSHNCFSVPCCWTQLTSVWNRHIVSKGTRAVKLCSNEILEFFTGGAVWHRLSCIMAVKLGRCYFLSLWMENSVSLPLLSVPLEGRTIVANW